MTEPTLTKVHSDARGEMYSITIGDRELMLLHSKAGTLRGGHSHDVPEGVMVLTGKMRYHKLQQKTFRGEFREWDAQEVLTEGEYSFNPSGEPHMGEFVEDTWILEWKICKDKHSWRNDDYEPWRAEVKASA